MASPLLCYAENNNDGSSQHSHTMHYLRAQYHRPGSNATSNMCQSWTLRKNRHICDLRRLRSSCNQPPSSHSYPTRIPLPQKKISSDHRAVVCYNRASVDMQCEQDAIWALISSAPIDRLSAAWDFHADHLSIWIFTILAALSPTLPQELLAKAAE